MTHLLLQDIELADNEENDNTFDIWFDYESKVFIAKENDGSREFRYRLTDSIENIITNHRKEILDYVLCWYGAWDFVGIGDIFMHGKYTELIKS